MKILEKPHPTQASAILHILLTILAVCVYLYMCLHASHNAFFIPIDHVENPLLFLGTQNKSINRLSKR